MASKKMKLPTTVYIKIVKESDGTEYLVAGHSAEELVVDFGEKITIGVYERVSTIKAEAIVKTDYND